MFALRVKHLLFLLLVSLLLHLCFTHDHDTDTDLAKNRPPPPPKSPSPPPPPPPPPPQPGFDFFMLVLTWPPSFCALYSCTPNEGLPKYSYFTIHGLWPRLIDKKQPLDCATTEHPTPELYEQLRSDLEDWWPRLANPMWQNNKELYDYEWNKHGTCSANKFKPEQYFKTAIELAKTYKPLDWFEEQALGDKRILPGGSYSYDKIKGAISAKWKKKSVLSCKSKSSKIYLYEIGLCFEDDGKTPRDCASESVKCPSSEDERDKDIIYFAAAASSPAPPPPPPSSSRIRLLELNN